MPSKIPNKTVAVKEATLHELEELQQELESVVPLVPWNRGMTIGFALAVVRGVQMEDALRHWIQQLPESSLRNEAFRTPPCSPVPARLTSRSGS